MNEIVPNRFTRQTALITGGAGSIGKAIAKRLAREAARVTLLDISPEALAKAKAELQGEGLHCQTIACDLSEERPVIDAVQKVLSVFNAIDVVVHAAGIAGPTDKRIDQVTLEEYDQVYAANQRSAFLIAKATLPHMEKKGYGRLVMLSSIAGKEGNPGMAPFNSSNAAIIGLVKGLGKEYADTGITVNGIAPAAIRDVMGGDTSPEQREHMATKIPLGRLGEVDELASLATWVASKECSYTTGFIFDLSGGRATY